MEKDFIIELLQKQIQGADLKPKTEEIGRIVSVGDGIVSIEGLPNAMFSEMILISSWPARNASRSEAGGPARPDQASVAALILNLQEYVVEAVVLGEDAKVHEGDIVRRTGHVLSIPVGDALLGRVVNPLGKELDDKGALKKEGLSSLPLERKAPQVMAREPVNTSLATGIKVIDATCPIGRGQRELIIGDRQIGKTALVQDVILNQLNVPAKTRPICVYVAIGQKASKVAKLVRDLESRGAMDYTCVVAATAADPASLWYLAPFAGCTIGEYFRDKGKDALVIYDDLTKHAWAWRQIALLLKRPPGREAYPGDIFYLHSRLLERAAKLSKEQGGGSLTALPIVETQLGDISAYIPTNVISITDGQIYLEPELFFKGQRPAMNIGLSVSRVGSSAQTKAMKKVASRIKLELAQYQELAAFTQFSQDLDAATKKRIDRGLRLTELLKQDRYAVMSMEEQVCSLFAGIAGFLDEIPVNKVLAFEQKLLELLQSLHPDILEDIRKTQDFSEDTEKKLSQVIEQVRKEFIE